MPKRLTRSPEERFFEKVDRTGDCWTWTGRLDAQGYASFWFDGHQQGAHRAAYKLFVGPIAAGLELDHLCHTEDLDCPGGRTCPHRRCVRPDHLEPVTPLVNSHRSRGNATKPRCPQGHSYNSRNTYVTPSGRRECRICKSARKQSERPRSKALPRLCLSAVESIGGVATSTQVLQWLQANGTQAKLAPVTTTLGRLASREQPLVEVIRKGIPGDNPNPSVWKITDAGRLLVA